MIIPLNAERYEVATRNAARDDFTVAFLSSDYAEVARLVYGYAHYSSPPFQIVFVDHGAKMGAVMTGGRWR